MKKIEKNRKKSQKVGPDERTETNFAGPQSAPRPHPDSKEQCFEREAYASLPFFEKNKPERKLCFSRADRLWCRGFKDWVRILILTTSRVCIEGPVFEIKEIVRKVFQSMVNKRYR